MVEPRWMRVLWTGLLSLTLMAASSCSGRQEVVVAPGSSEPVQATTPSNINTSGQSYPSSGSTNNGLNTASTPPDVDLSRPLSACPVDADALMPMQPVAWSVADGPRRWGYGVTQAAVVRSSPMVPIEVCGVMGQTSWLVSLVCPNGSRPFESELDAHEHRLGNVGPGGRCGTIVDHYQVPCPGMVYDVYMDLYHCTPTESFR